MQPLSSAQLFERAPAIFSEEPVFTASEKYKMVKTYDVVKSLTDHNFYPVMAAQSKTRTPGGKAYAKHMVRFRHKDLLDENTGFVPDILISNSHNTVSSWQVDLAVFRFICTNGMIVKSADFGTMRVKHAGNNVLEEVVKSVQYAQDSVPLLLERIKHWQSVELDEMQELDLAREVVIARYGKMDGSPILPSALTVSRRYEDQGRDLWTIFNKMQENIMKGGLSSGLRGEKRRRTTRPIRGVSETIRFNREAWAVADATYQQLISRLTAPETV